MALPLLVRRVGEDEVVAATAFALVAQRRAASRPTTTAPVSRSFSRFAWITRARLRGRARRRRSSPRRARAPRDPSRPSPAKRSSTRAPSTGPMIENTASRTRSPVGRVTTPFGAAIRCPFREPATILTRLAEVLGLAEQAVDGRRRGALVRERQRADVARSLEQMPGRGEGGRSGDRSSRTGARREAAPRRGSRGRARRARSRPSSRPSPRAARAAVSESSCFAPRDEQAVRLLRPAPDPAAELVELREAEAVGLLHDHDRRVRDVDADLDHGRRDEDVQLARLEARHHAPPLGRSQASVQAADAVAAELGACAAARPPPRRHARHASRTPRSAGRRRRPGARRRGAGAAASRPPSCGPRRPTR